MPVLEAGFGPFLALTSFALAVFATAVTTTAFILTTHTSPPWALMVACFVACGACAAFAFWLGTSVYRDLPRLRIEQPAKLPANDTAGVAREGEPRG